MDWIQEAQRLFKVPKPTHFTDYRHEGIQLKKLNTRQIKGKGGMGTCAGPLFSPGGLEEPWKPWHEPRQVVWRGDRAGVETDLSLTMRVEASS
jgi:hypothetical protein